MRAIARMLVPQSLLKLHSIPGTRLFASFTPLSQNTAYSSNGINDANISSDPSTSISSTGGQDQHTAYVEGEADAYVEDGAYYVEGEQGYESSYTEEHQVPQMSREEVVAHVLRGCHAAEVAAHSYFHGQSTAVSGNLRRPDVEFFQNQEAQQLEAVKDLLPQHRTRPSLLLNALQAGFCTLGALTAITPKPVQLVVSGAVQDALQDHFTEQLRVMRESGAVEEAPGVRDVVCSLRDTERAPEGAPSPPDIASFAMNWREAIQKLSWNEVVGATVKQTTSIALNAARRV